MNGTKLMKSFFALALVFVVCAGMGNALTLQTYSFTPSPLKAGARGSMNLVLVGSASEYVSSATIFASGYGLAFTGSQSIGDLGSGATTNVAVPFIVRSDAKPGAYVASVSISYLSTATGATGPTRSVTFSVPYTISGVLGLEARLVSASKTSVSPGESFIATVEFENKGDDINNLVITSPSASSFALDGVSQVFVGSIKSKEKKSVEVPLKASSSAVAGNQAVSLALVYDNVNGASFSETDSVGSVLVTGTAPKISVTLSTANVFPGKTATFAVTVKNEGGDEIHNVRVSLPETSTFFTPLDYSEKNIGSIVAGGEGQAIFSVGINSDIVSKFYGLQITVSYDGPAGSSTLTKTAGIEISAATQLDAMVTTSPAPVSVKEGAYSVSIQVSNTGDTAVRALSVVVDSDAFEFNAGNYGYIGTVNVDDYSTVSFNAITKKGLQEGTHYVDVTLNYKDTFNVPHSENKRLELKVVSVEKAALSASEKKAPSGDSTGPLTIIVVVVLAVGAYFGYKKFFKKRKGPQHIKSL
ncbi:MAG: COG1361 S-layer family protein [Candidatus Micrarchaeia archaeon]